MINPENIGYVTLLYVAAPVSVADPLGMTLRSAISALVMFAVTQPTPYQDGLVEDVILNELHPQYAADGSNVGMVQVRFIPGDRDVPKEKLNWAAPIDSSIREYPLKNELVLVFYSLGRLFYTRRINSTNKTTESLGRTRTSSPASLNTSNLLLPVPSSLTSTS